MLSIRNLASAAAMFMLQQVLALFNKAIRKLHSHLRAVKEAAVERQLPKPARLVATTAAAAAAGDGPLLGEGVDVGLDQELEEAAQVEREKMRQQFRPEDLQQFAITGKAGSRPACLSSPLPLVAASYLQQRLRNLNIHPSLEGAVFVWCVAAGGDDDFARAAGAGIASGGMISIKSSKAADSSSKKAAPTSGGGGGSGQLYKKDGKKSKSKQQGGGSAKKFKSK